MESGLSDLWLRLFQLLLLLLLTAAISPVRSRTSTLMAISPIAAKGTHDAKTHRATFAASAAVSMDSRPEAFATIPT